jgi:hypothetical protein
MFITGAEQIHDLFGGAPTKEASVFRRNQSHQGSCPKTKARNNSGLLVDHKMQLMRHAPDRLHAPEYGDKMLQLPGRITYRGRVLSPGPVRSLAAAPPIARNPSRLPGTPSKPDRARGGWYASGYVCLDEMPARGRRRVIGSSRRPAIPHGLFDNLLPLGIGYWSMQQLLPYPANLKSRRLRTNDSK